MWRFHLLCRIFWYSNAQFRAIGVKAIIQKHCIHVCMQSKMRLSVIVQAVQMSILKWSHCFLRAWLYLQLWYSRNHNSEIQLRCGMHTLFPKQNSLISRLKRVQQGKGTSLSSRWPRFDQMVPQTPWGILEHCQICPLQISTPIKAKKNIFFCLVKINTIGPFRTVNSIPVFTLTNNLPQGKQHTHSVDINPTKLVLLGSGKASACANDQRQDLMGPAIGKPQNLGVLGSDMPLRLSREK